MKKIAAIVICFLSLLNPNHLLADRIIYFRELPLQAQEFLNKYFLGEKINVIWEKIEANDTQYKVQFAAGQYILFNDEGEWEEIDYPSGIPSKIVSKRIMHQIKKKFSSPTLTKLEKTGTGLKIEVNHNNTIFIHDLKR